jgi:chorismate synthase
VSKKIESITTPRPGHADMAGVTKYAVDDIRLILERASARETAARVAVGAVARRFLDEFGISINGHTVSIGEYRVKRTKSINWNLIEKSLLRCADTSVEKLMMAAIDEAKVQGDTLGGIFEVVASGVPVGLGSHVQHDRRLDGRIAQAIMSIPAVKSVEIGAGFGIASVKGSEAQDVILAASSGARLPWSRASNNAGGIEGGMSNGEPIIVRAAVKPIATLGKPLPSIDLSTGKKAEAHYERSDICVVPAAGIIGEAMMAIVLANAMLEKFGGDHLKETMANYKNYINSAHSLNRNAASKRT